MTPSERVRAISEISQRLADQAWYLIDLTLSEFGAQTTELWQGDARSYVVAMLRSASDETLASLASHVGLQVGGPAIAVEPDFWFAGHFKLFISHTHEHARFAGDLKSALRAYGIDGFIAHKDIEPSTEWVTAIELALTSCDALVALMTPDFHPSNWTDQEIGFALGRGRLVVPVAMPTIPYGFIQRIQAVPNITEPQPLAAELFQRLRRNKASTARIEEGVVHRLANTESFNAARANLDLLYQVERLSRDSSLRLLQAIDDNVQLKDAQSGGIPVPDRIRTLIQERGDASVLQEAPDDIPF